MKEKAKNFKEKNVVSGSRKRSVARAVISDGNGAISINARPIESFNTFQRLILSEPLVIAEPLIKDTLTKIDIHVKIAGGGVESQVEAARLAIARALVAFTKSTDLRNAFLKYDRTLLVADTRRKEARKWGDSKARAKRQKSYR
jgi:small subunit ribosomal protein S9